MTSHFNTSGAPRKQDHVLWQPDPRCAARHASEMHPQSMPTALSWRGLGVHITVHLCPQRDKYYRDSLGIDIIFLARVAANGDADQGTQVQCWIKKASIWTTALDSFDAHTLFCGLCLFRVYQNLKPGFFEFFAYVHCSHSVTSLEIDFIFHNFF